MTPPGTGAQISVEPANPQGLNHAKAGEPLVELTLTGKLNRSLVWRVQWCASAGWSTIAKIPGMDDLSPARLRLARDEWRPEVAAVAIRALAEEEEEARRHW